MSTDVPGIAVPTVPAWLEDHVPGAAGPFRLYVLAGGHSNLTYRVTGANSYILTLQGIAQLFMHELGSASS